MPDLIKYEDLSKNQKSIVNSDRSGSIFLEGQYGVGKTTVAINRLYFLLDNHVSPDSVLILLPQRTLSKPYNDAISQFNNMTGTLPRIETIGSLSRKVVNNFWPLVTKDAGFLNTAKPITFLNIESSQYYLSQIIEPLEKKGYFSAVKIDRNRLLSQIIDSLNKSAVVGFPHSDIGNRLINSWHGDPNIKLAYKESQEAINLFRNFCLENNLLDFSLQVEIFSKYLCKNVIVKKYLNQYKHLIYDNIEEDIPITHDLISDMFSNFESALLVFDEGGGYRSFLGADPSSGANLKDQCEVVTSLSKQWIMSTNLDQINSLFNKSINNEDGFGQKSKIEGLSISHQRFFTEMIEWVSSEIARLVQSDVPPEQIVVLSPYMSDSLRFSLDQSLNKINLTTYSNRPSRTILDEPVIRCVLTISKIAHPQWGLTVSEQEVCATLTLAIKELDLIRASLLSKIVFHKQDESITLSSFNQINPSTRMQERITFYYGEKYERLREWIEAYKEKSELPLDIFISQLFGEVLSQSGYGLANNFDAALLISQLINSIRRFRLDIGFVDYQDKSTTNKEYVQFLERGIIASQFIPRWREQPPDSILIAPAYTFIMMNKPVRYQFWIDIGNMGWWERLDQPLTHPYVLSRSWVQSAFWTDADEFNANQKAMARLVSGLIHRCKDHIYICTTSMNEQGTENNGPLLKAVQRILRHNEIKMENYDV